MAKSHSVDTRSDASHPGETAPSSWKSWLPLIGFGLVGLLATAGILGGMQRRHEASKGPDIRLTSGSGKAVFEFDRDDSDASPARETMLTPRSTDMGDDAMSMASRDESDVESAADSIPDGIRPEWTPERTASVTKSPDGRADHSWLPKIKATAGGSREPAAVAAEIDALIQRRLVEADIAPAPQAGDAEFLRRAFLDLNGRIPEASRTVEFLDSRDPDKRAKLIDELLADHDLGLHLARTWRDLIIKRDADRKIMPNEVIFVQWLARQFNHNVPWDRVVRTMLTAEGDEALAGETYFILANEDDKQPAPNKIVGSAAALFMGIQLQCAECHVHPMHDGWDQQDFWGLAAFFAGTRADRDPAGNTKGVLGTARVVQRFGAGESGKKGKGKGKRSGATPGVIAIPDPRNDGQYLGRAKAKLFETPDEPVSPVDARRNVAAEWIASPRDPYFAPAAVNRIWSWLFARGLVNPLDDMRPDNKPTHPELLELLSNDFTASGYDVKHLLKCLCLTQAYQRTSRTKAAASPKVAASLRDAKPDGVTTANPSEPSPDPADLEAVYARMPVKVLSPEMLFDSLAVATGDRVRRDEKGADAAGQKGSGFALMKRTEFYDTREYDESAAEYTYGIPQLLRLMNRELTAACDETAKKLSASRSREKIVERMYLATLSRRPTTEETERIVAFVAKQNGPPQKAWSAALWALLNSAEFVCNR